MRFAPEGWALFSPISAAAAVALIAWIFSRSTPLLWAGVAVGILAFVILLFFRDPERTPPADPLAVVAPADGKVIVSETLEDGRKHVAIFLSIFDVHVNRTPTSGRVTEVAHTPGAYFHAGSLRAAGENARMDVTAETRYGTVSWRQVSGAIARKISCRLKPGDAFRTGDRFGLIYFGSRMDVYLPPAAKLVTEKGARVLAGESVIAAFLKEDS